jgi:uncharacterized protein YciI
MPGLDKLAKLGKTIFAQALQLHSEYMQMLYEQGKLIYAGPFLDI